MRGGTRQERKEQGWGSGGEGAHCRSQSARGQEVGTHYLSFTVKEVEAWEEVRCPGSSFEAPSGSPPEQVKLKDLPLPDSQFPGVGSGCLYFPYAVIWSLSVPDLRVGSPGPRRFLCRCGMERFSPGTQVQGEIGCHVYTNHKNGSTQPSDLGPLSGEVGRDAHKAGTPQKQQAVTSKSTSNLSPKQTTLC